MVCRGGAVPPRPAEGRRVVVVQGRGSRDLGHLLCDSLPPARDAAADRRGVDGPEDAEVAVRGHGVERDMRILAVFLLLQAQDAAPPSLVPVSAGAEPTEVIVVFNRPVDPAAAELAANYAIDNGVKVESASRGLDLRTVTLTTSSLAEGVSYTLAVKGVRDCAVPPAAVAPGTQKAFTFVKGLFGGAPKEEARAPRIPKFSKPVLFHTPEADAILAALQVFPKNNPWNEDISRRPVHPDSDRIVASVGKDKGVRCNLDMAFILVPSSQARVEVKLVPPSEESDKGPYPVPD